MIDIVIFITFLHFRKVRVLLNLFSLYLLC